MFLKVSNDFKFLMFAGRLFHSLCAATELDVPADRSPLYKGTTSLSGAFVDWERVRPIVAGFKDSKIKGFKLIYFQRLIHNPTLLIHRL